MQDQISDTNQLANKLSADSKRILSSEIKRLLTWLDDNRYNAEIGEKMLEKKKLHIEKLLQTELDEF